MMQLYVLKYKMMCGKISPIRRRLYIKSEEAFEILKKYNKDEFHIRHALTVEGVMRYFAKELNENVEYWGNIGLLHENCIQKNTARMEEYMIERIKWIDILRAIAIIFVVIGHTLTEGEVQTYFYSFHIPLFFFISGMLFKNKEEKICNIFD